MMYEAGLQAHQAGDAETAVLKQDRGIDEPQFILYLEHVINIEDGCLLGCSTV
jgi:hypothetical protein